MSKSRKNCRESLWLKVFCPEEQCLMEEEKFSKPLPCEGETWLNVFCPEEQCVMEQSTDAP